MFREIKYCKKIARNIEEMLEDFGNNVEEILRNFGKLLKKFCRKFRANERKL